MKQIFYKTESSLDNIIIKKILHTLGCTNQPIPLFPDFTGKSGILRADNWKKCINLTLNPDAILILLMDIDNDHQCVSSFLNFLETTYGKDHQRENCNIFLSIRTIEIWLMADLKGFSLYFGVPIVMLQRVFQKSEYDVIDPKGEMKTLIKNYGKPEFRRIIDDSRYFLSVQGDYMNNCWNPINAKENSKSLQRMIDKIGACIG